MAHQFSTDFLKDSAELMRFYQRLGEQAIAQTPDAMLASVLDPESNSIATIVKHLAGNMRSRWTDFLTTDGEKADRRRDTEFETPPKDREEVMACWNAGWRYVYDALAKLTEADMGRTVYIRTQPHSVMQAVSRQITHYAYHVGQIVYLAKHFAGDRWTAVTVPRGKSAEFTAGVARRETSQR